MLTRTSDRLCYSADYRAAASILLRNGINLFRKSTLVNNIHHAVEIASNPSESLAADAMRIVRLSDNSLDYYCAATAFELFAKGLLLNERKVVHIIECRNVLKPLARQQKSQPVDFDALMEIEHAINPNGSDKIISLKDRSLSILAILRSEMYRREIGFGPEIEAALKPILRYRNEQAHLFSTWAESPLETTQTFALLDTFVRSRMVPMHNTLVRNFGYPNCWLVEA